MQQATSTSEHLQALSDELRSERNVHAWRAAFATLRRDCRRPLEDDEVREVVAGHVTAKVWADSETARYIVEVSLFGEVMNAYSGTWRTEQDALRSYAGTLCLLASSSRPA